MHDPQKRKEKICKVGRPLPQGGPCHHPPRRARSESRHRSLAPTVTSHAGARAYASQPGPPARPGSEAAVEIVISQNVLRFVLWPGPFRV